MRSVLIRGRRGEATWPQSSDGSDAAVSQGVPGGARNGTGRHGSPLEPLDGVWPRDTWIWDFWGSHNVRTNFCGLKATQFVIICYRGPRKQTAEAQCPKARALERAAHPMCLALEFCLFPTLGWISIRFSILPQAVRPHAFIEHLLYSRARDAAVNKVSLRPLSRPLRRFFHLLPVSLCVLFPLCIPNTWHNAQHRWALDEHAA